MMFVHRSAAMTSCSFKFLVCPTMTGSKVPLTGWPHVFGFSCGCVRCTRLSDFTFPPPNAFLQRSLSLCLEQRARNDGFGPGLPRNCQLIFCNALKLSLNRFWRPPLDLFSDDNSPYKSCFRSRSYDRRSPPNEFEIAARLCRFVGGLYVIELT